MLSIKRFFSFDECKEIWQELEKAIFHYPFQSWWYQKLFADKFILSENLHILGIFDDGGLIAIGGFETTTNEVIFVGMKLILGRKDMGVTDYGDLLFNNRISTEKTGQIWELLKEYFKAKNISSLKLEFVREDSHTYKYFQTKNNIEKQEVSPFIMLPATWDEYLSGLDRKDRHELKRKIKRLEEKKSFHFCTQKSIKKDFDDFIRLHRMSDPEKEKFMTPEMENLFWSIVSADKNDWEVNFCNLSIDGKEVASMMYFENSGQILLYNSGFDPGYNYFSVGLILASYLIKKSIEKKLKIYDFLRGNERYKYDLGSKDMNLYKISCSLY